MYYLLDENKKPYQVVANTAYFTQLEGQKVQAYNEDNKLRVSTVFLGLDHRFDEDAPVVFETMVFPLDSYSEIDMRRYSTYAEAMKGHNELCTEYLQNYEPKLLNKVV